MALSDWMVRCHSTLIPGRAARCQDEALRGKKYQLKITIANGVFHRNKRRFVRRTMNFRATSTTVKSTRKCRYLMRIVRIVC